MPLEVLLASYAGWGILALATRRHWPAWANRSAIRVSALRGAGALLLLLSLILAVRERGHQGPVDWMGALMLGAGVLILLISWRPRVALRSAGLSLMLVPFAIGLRTTL